MSIRHDIFDLEDEDITNVDFFMKHGGYEPFILENISNLKYDKMPEIAELDRMVSESPEGLFEDSPENCVSLFEFIFGYRGFDIDKLVELGEISEAVRKEYFKRPRTVKEYCTTVWREHKQA